jgi:hypothetical protein
MFWELPRLVLAVLQWEILTKVHVDYVGFVLRFSSRVFGIFDEPNRPIILIFSDQEWLIMRWQSFKRTPRRISAFALWLILGKDSVWAGLLRSVK